MLIHAARRPRTAHDEPIPEPERWTVEADNYDIGMAEVNAAVPEGWLLVGVRVER